ncbi:hypothetical protein BG004_004306, partial [Podila humilis]
MVSKGDAWIIGPQKKPTWRDTITSPRKTRIGCSISDKHKHDTCTVVRTAAVVACDSAESPPSSPMPLSFCQQYTGNDSEDEAVLACSSALPSLPSPTTPPATKTTTPSSSSSSSSSPRNSTNITSAPKKMEATLLKSSPRSTPAAVRRTSITSSPREPNQIDTRPPFHIGASRASRPRASSATSGTVKPSNLTQSRPSPSSISCLQKSKSPMLPGTSKSKTTQRSENIKNGRAQSTDATKSPRRAPVLLTSITEKPTAATGARPERSATGVRSNSLSKSCRATSRVRISPALSPASSPPKANSNAKQTTSTNHDTNKDSEQQRAKSPQSPRKSRVSNRKTESTSFTIPSRSLFQPLLPPLTIEQCDHRAGTPKTHLESPAPETSVQYVSTGRTPPMSPLAPTSKEPCVASIEAKAQCSDTSENRLVETCQPFTGIKDTALQHPLSPKSFTHEAETFTFQVSTTLSLPRDYGQDASISVLHQRRHPTDSSTRRSPLLRIARDPSAVFEIMNAMRQSQEQRRAHIINAQDKESEEKDTKQPLVITFKDKQSYLKIQEHQRASNRDKRVAAEMAETCKGHVPSELPNGAAGPSTATTSSCKPSLAISLSSEYAPHHSHSSIADRTYAAVASVATTSDRIFEQSTISDNVNSEVSPSLSIPKSICGPHLSRSYTDSQSMTAALGQGDVRSTIANELYTFPVSQGSVPEWPPSHCWCPRKHGETQTPLRRSRSSSSLSSMSSQQDLWAPGYHHHHHRMPGTRFQHESQEYMHYGGGPQSRYPGGYPYYHTDYYTPTAGFHHSPYPYQHNFHHYHQPHYRPHPAGNFRVSESPQCFLQSSSSSSASSLGVEEDSIVSPKTNPYYDSDSLHPDHFQYPQLAVDNKLERQQHQQQKQWPVGKKERPFVSERRRSGSGRGSVRVGNENISLREDDNSEPDNEVSGGWHHHQHQHQKDLPAFSNRDPDSAPVSRTSQHDLSSNSDYSAMVGSEYSLTTLPQLPLQPLPPSSSSSSQYIWSEQSSLVEDRSPALSTACIEVIAPLGNMDILSKRLANLQVIDSFCAPSSVAHSGILDQTNDKAQSQSQGGIASWEVADDRQASQLHCLLTHLANKIDSEMEQAARIRHHRKKTMEDVHSSRASVESAGIYEQLLRDWIRRLLHIPLDNIRLYPGLKREMDKI